LVGWPVKTSNIAQYRSSQPAPSCCSRGPTIWGLRKKKWISGGPRHSAVQVERPSRVPEHRALLAEGRLRPNPQGPTGWLRERTRLPGYKLHGPHGPHQLMGLPKSVPSLSPLPWDPGCIADNRRDWPGTTARKHWHITGTPARPMTKQKVGLSKRGSSLRSGEATSRTTRHRPIIRQVSTSSRRPSNYAARGRREKPREGSLGRAGYP
jgi:hypothetical protein